MRRADRLLQLIQILRRNRRPVTGDRMASELEVSLRTIYRDISSLMAQGVPIRGEAGMGYVMGEGFDLPPLMFTAEELEALMLGQAASNASAIDGSLNLLRVSMAADCTSCGCWLEMSGVSTGPAVAKSPKANKRMASMRALVDALSSAARACA